MSNADEASPVQGDVSHTTYHDLEVEYDGKRFALSDAAFGIELTCNRVGGWRLWNTWQKRDNPDLLAGEYDFPKLRIYVKGTVVCG